jgi:hypothetical protein
MSKAVYWQQGSLWMWCCEDESPKKIAELNNYLGNILAFDPITTSTLFQEEQTTLANIAEQTLTNLPMEQRITQAQFTKNGTQLWTAQVIEKREMWNKFLQNTVVIYPEEVNWDFLHQYAELGDGPYYLTEPNALSVWDVASASLIQSYPTDNLIGDLRVSVEGNYLLPYTGCYAFASALDMLGAVFAINEPFDDPLIVVSEACDADQYTFTKDETILFASYGCRILRFRLDEIEESVDIISHQDPWELVEEYTFFNGCSGSNSPSSDRITALQLSPSDNFIIVIVNNITRIETTDETQTFFTPRIDIYKLNEERTDFYLGFSLPEATSIVFSPDEAYMATDVGLWSQSGYSRNSAVDGTISAFTSDSQLLATYQDGNVTLWSVNSPIPLAQYSLSNVRQLAFNKDSTRLYIVRDGDVQVWGVAGNTVITENLEESP